MNATNEQPKQIAQPVSGFRRYTYKGCEIPSVTSVLDVGKSDYLLGWHAKLAATYALDKVVKRTKSGRRDYKDLGLTVDSAKGIVDDAMEAPLRVRDEAAGVGSRIHELIAEGRRPTDSDSDSVRIAYQSYEMWLEDIGEFTFVEQERPIACHSRDGFWYAGTPDAVIEVDGRRILIDWKVTSAIRISHALQAGAYATAWNSPENLQRVGKPVTAAWVIRLAKAFPYYEYKEVDIERAYLTFEKYLYIQQTEGDCWKTASK